MTDSDPEKTPEPPAGPGSARRRSFDRPLAGASDALEEKADEDGQQDQPNAVETLLVSFDGGEDPMDPKNKKTATKWLVVGILAMGSFCVTFTSSLYTTTYQGLNAEFGTSRIVATLGLTLYVFGLGVAPMALGPLSEFYGRRIIYLIAFSGFLIWLVPCAVAPNIATILVARFFDGLCGSAFLSVAGGTVGDLFTKDQLQGPMLIYSASPFLGPATAPLVGGFINYRVDWRWSFYVLLIYAGLTLIAIVLFVPETYPPVMLRIKAQMKRRETGDDRWKAPIEISDRSVFRTVVTSLYRPFQMLLLDPMCLNLCLFSAILLGILYLFFGAFPLVFGGVYGFNLWQSGLSFLGLFVGMLVGMASDPLIWQKNYARLLDKRERETGERKSEPEYRLPPSIFGGWFCAVGLFWFAWAIENTHWVVPIIGTVFFGIGIITSYSGIFTFMVEAYPVYAASALAANSFARSSFAAAFPLFGIQMYSKLNYHWATTLLAFLTLAMAPFPYLFFIHGKRLRQRSKFGSA